MWTLRARLGVATVRYFSPSLEQFGSVLQTVLSGALTNMGWLPSPSG
jgi:hypothetical protein